MRDRFRNRDKTVFFFLILLIAILLLGIGYAILQDVFSSWNNETEISTTNYKIYFVKSSSSGAGIHETSIDSSNPAKASFSVKDLVGYNDTVTFEYTIRNEEDQDLDLDIVLSNISNQSHFSIESNINELNKTTIKPKEEKKLMIKVKVTKVYTGKEETIDATANIVIRAKGRN